VTDPGEIRIPDVAEPLLAFRVWAVADDESLWSLNAAINAKQRPSRTGYKRQQVQQLLEAPVGRWETEMEATCLLAAATCKAGATLTVGPKGKEREHGRIPDPDCSCGLYAATDLDVIAEYVLRKDDWTAAVGLVEGYGQVVPAKFGWKAEKAKILALFAVAEDFTVPHGRLRQVADRYGVPLVHPWSDTAEEYAAAVREGTLAELGEMR
jgi:hypothetical protein